MEGSYKHLLTSTMKRARDIYFEDDSDNNGLGAIMVSMFKELFNAATYTINIEQFINEINKLSEVFCKLKKKTYPRQICYMSLGSEENWTWYLGSKRNILKLKTDTHIQDENTFNKILTANTEEKQLSISELIYNFAAILDCKSKQSPNIYVGTVDGVTVKNTPKIYGGKETYLQHYIDESYLFYKSEYIFPVGKNKDKIKISVVHDYSNIALKEVTNNIMLFLHIMKLVAEGVYFIYDSNKDLDSYLNWNLLATLKFESENKKILVEKWTRFTSVGESLKTFDASNKLAEKLLWAMYD